MSNEERELNLWYWEEYQKSQKAKEQKDFREYCDFMFYEINL